MDETVTSEQAKTIAALLPTLMRQLFAMQNDPVAELPLGQLRVCLILYDGPRRMSALSRELGVSLSAMTQIADRLEHAGLVTRVAGERDRRVRRLQLTQQGRQMMRLREEIRVERVAAVLEHLSPKGRSEVQAALEVLIRACAAARSPSTAGASG